jgi:Flp pilus assembly pilin Flp
MTQPARATRGARGSRAHRDRGASAVEYGLLVAGITAAFLVGAIALQGVSKAVFDQTVTSVEKDDTAP